MRAHRVAFFSLVLITLAACGGSNDGGSNDVVFSEPDETTAQMQTPPNTSTGQEEFLSAVTGISYPVDIYLPPNYSDDGPALSVIYELDGQWVSESHANIISALNKEVIYIVIHQGPENRRFTDFLLPGAEDYFQFFTQEFIPHIESRFNIDPDNRTLAGASAGGFFTALAMLMDDPINPVFNNYLSMDTPFLSAQYSLLMGLEENRFLTSQTMDVTLILTGALLPASIGGFADEVDVFQEQLENRNYSGLEIVREDYDVDHFGIADPSFSDMLELLFE